MITVAADPSSLWPPNHKLVEVHLTVDVSDLCDPDPVVVLEATPLNPPAAPAARVDDTER